MTPTASPETAARLTAARKARGLTQEAAGAAVGVDPSTIANWENLRGEPRASQIVALARAYETTPAALLPESDHAPAPESRA